MDIDSQKLALLNSGQAASSNLGEALAVDFAALMAAAVPDVPASGIDALRAAAGQGVSKKMRLAGKLLYETFGPDGLAPCASHPSDTVRGWACFALALCPARNIEERLEAVRPLADDRHRSAHALMLEAITEYINREEKRSQYLRDGQAAWQHYQETGLHLSAEEVEAWIDTWGTENEQDAPPCHR